MINEQPNKESEEKETTQSIESSIAQDNTKFQSQTNEDYNSSVINQYEEKYNKLYKDYTTLQKNRNQLRKEIEEFEMRTEQTKKKEGATINFPKITHEYQ